jgi:DNA-binding NarL/FixJ family response regulator
MAITVSIVEDDRATRENLAALMNGATTLRCVGTYPTAEKALAGIPRDNPDVALVDINLPGMSGIDCVAQLKAKLPQLQVLMLTMYEQSNLIFDSLRAGASGYLLKTTPPDELIQAFEEVRSGGSPMSIRIARKVVQYFQQTEGSSCSMEKLSPREYEILSLLAKGRLYKEIAAELGISHGTLRTHQMHIYEKLQVKSRTEAAAKFLQRQ